MKSGIIFLSLVILAVVASKFIGRPAPAPSAPATSAPIPSVADRPRVITAEPDHVPVQVQPESATSEESTPALQPTAPKYAREPEKPTHDQLYARATFLIQPEYNGVSMDLLNEKVSNLERGLASISPAHENYQNVKRQYDDATRKRDRVQKALEAREIEISRWIKDHEDMTLDEYKQGIPAILEKAKADAAKAQAEFKASQQRHKMDWSDGDR